MSPARKSRIDGAKKRLEQRMRLSDKELVDTAKRFRDRLKKQCSVETNEVVEYRTWMGQELDKLNKIHLG